MNFLVHVSVRNLVEFVLRNGDIDNRVSLVFGTAIMQKGSRIHRKLQKEAGPDYMPEVSLKLNIKQDKYDLVIEGRADGVVDNDKGLIIDEIKSTNMDISRLKEPLLEHYGQAACYAYMYISKNFPDGIQKPITVRVTYVDMTDTEYVKTFDKEVTKEELEEFFDDLILKYKRFTDYDFESKMALIETANETQFPFEYREGQREIAHSVYKVISANKNLYIQAPTGIGKTISTIFPAVKAIGTKKADKIFYLTAKTIARTVALSACNTLRQNGLKMTSVLITAKDKMCILEKADCNPESCERAKGHFDRVNDAIYDCITNEDDITSDVILKYAKKHNVCPYELSLDLSNYAGIIICDYNYAFDPNVRLKRYFGEGVAMGNYVLLADEAHNLVDRAREMYSAVLVKEDVLATKKLLKKIEDKKIKTETVCKYLDKLNKELLALKKECEGFKVTNNLESLENAVFNCFGILGKFLEKARKFESRKEVLDFYFTLMQFIDVYGYTESGYVNYGAGSADGDFFIKLFCVDPSKRLKECMDSCVSTVMFSATLIPVNYYKNLLSGDLNDYAIYCKSPFEQEKRLIVTATDVSTRYKERTAETYKKIAGYISKTVSCMKGNYMVFFPSYAFLNKVYETFNLLGFANDFEIIKQENNMSEQDREGFLENFELERDNPLLAFCVMGGAFSEGIDLTHDKLIGAIVVGAGLPQVGSERDLIKEYFDTQGQNGFDYAYKYPGLNKVMQAAGRVIRTADDVGVVALLDKRFTLRDYNAYFPSEWDDMRFVNEESVGREVKDFWRRV